MLDPAAAMADVPEPAPARRFAAPLAAAALVLAACAVFAPSLRGGFLWDDNHFLTANPLVRADDGLRRIWFSTEPLDYWPVTYSMMWCEWRVWGDWAPGYRLVNLLLHVAAAVLLWRVLRRLRVPGAWAAALIFAIHPATVGTVAWITERKNTLSLVFLLLAALGWLRFDGERRRGWYVLSLAAFVLALLSKSSTAVLPALLCGFAWWRRGRLERRDLAAIAPYFALAAATAVATIWFQQHRSIADAVVRPEGFASRLAAAGWAVWFYLDKALLPTHLSFVYPRWRVDAASPAAWAPLLLLAATSALLWRYRRGWGRAPLLALGAYVVALLPVIGFFAINFMRYSLVADHWHYLPLACILPLPVALGTLVVKGRGARAALLAAFAIPLAAMSVSHAGAYVGELALWRDALRHAPASSMVQTNLGVELKRRGRVAEALALYTTAAERYHNPVAYNNRGLYYAAQGRDDRALADFTRAIELDPGYSMPYVNRAQVLLQQKRYAAALRDCDEALRLSPHFAAAREVRAAVLAHRQSDSENKESP